MATVLSPSSLAARMTRMAISERLATSSFLGCELERVGREESDIGGGVSKGTPHPHASAELWGHETRAGFTSGVNPECAVGKLLPEPPVRGARNVTEIPRPRLTLQRRDHFPGGITPGPLVLGFRHHHHNMPRPPLQLPPGHNHPDSAQIRRLLQLRQRSRLPPPETRPEIPQPTKQVIRPLFI